MQHSELRIMIDSARDDKSSKLQQIGGLSHSGMVKKTQVSRSIASLFGKPDCSENWIVRKHELRSAVAPAPNSRINQTRCVISLTIRTSGPQALPAHRLNFQRLAAPFTNGAPRAFPIARRGTTWPHPYLGESGKPSARLKQA